MLEGPSVEQSRRGRSPVDAFLFESNVAHRPDANQRALFEDPDRAQGSRREFESLPTRASAGRRVM